MTDDKDRPPTSSTSEADLELLDLVLDEEGLEERTPGIPRADRSAPLPLSIAQERVWFIDQLEGSTAFHMPEAHRLRGRLDVTVLEAAFCEMVRRHEVLRTTLPSEDGRPSQVIHLPAVLQLPVVDLAGLQQEAREAESKRLARTEARRPFDLAQERLLRYSLLRLGVEEHILLVNIHHVVSDGWSMAIIRRELVAHYNAFIAGKASTLPEFAVQYADYAVWQRQWLQVEQEVAFWREQLSGTPPLELPTDRPRPPVQSHHGGLVRHRLSGELVQQLQELSQQEGATLFMTLLTAFKVLLSRLSGQRDICVGTPIAGRDHLQLEGLIGFFLSTLALRTDLDGDPSFIELLKRVRETCLGAYAHQHLPFEKLLTELQPERDRSRNPFFQVLFNMVTVPQSDLELEGLTAERCSSGEVESKFDLTLYLKQEGKEILLSLVYNTVLFDTARAEEMVRQLEHLLVQIADDPDRPVGQHSLLTEQSRPIIPDPLAELSPTWAGAVSERVARWAQEAPDRVVVIGPDVAWTYSQLEQAANRLASYLRACGVGPEDVIAVYAARDPSLVWALLGIEMAGAALVMLDPAYPAARLIDLLEAAKPRGLIALAAAEEIPPALSSYIEAAPLRCRLTLPRHLNHIEGSPLAQVTEAPPPKIRPEPEDLQHVAMTSGTMGQPKAIAVPHRGMSQSVRWYTREFGLGDSDRFCMLSGLTFQPLLREIYAPLWVGGALYVPKPSDFEEPERLINWLRQEKISVAQLTPAMAQLLTGAGAGAATGRDAPAGVESLRNVSFTGDVLRRRDVEQLQQLCPNATCVNFFGVSEKIGPASCEVVPQRAFQEELGPSSTTELNRLSIGQGIEGVQLLLLNRCDRQVGIGEVGEICLRTPYLARGYLDNAELTRRHFTVNPLTGREEDRIYRTGDLGRYLPDGRVEYMARADAQVQIRGFRIETDEVGGVLKQHPAVRDAAVIASEDPTGGKRLVAYVAMEGGAEISVATLLEHMQETLPAYMLPSMFVRVDALPVTPRGKLDRTALPPPDWSSALRDKEHVAPRGPIEEVVAEIWSDVLKTERVGAHDDFWELGGHSLLATQVIAKIRQTFEVDLELRTLFESSSLAALSREVEKRMVEQFGKDVVDELLREFGEHSD